MNKPTDHQLFEQLKQEIDLANSLNGVYAVEALRKARGETVNALLDLLVLRGHNREEVIDQAREMIGQ